MCLKNLPGVCKMTTLKSSFVKNLLGNQVSLLIHFLFLMNVRFIWYALRSQQMLSFHTGRILNFHLNSPSYIGATVSRITRQTCGPFYMFTYNEKLHTIEDWKNSEEEHQCVEDLNFANLRGFDGVSSNQEKQKGATKPNPFP